MKIFKDPFTTVSYYRGTNVKKDAKDHRKICRDSKNLDWLKPSFKIMDTLQCLRKHP